MHCIDSVDDGAINYDDSLNLIKLAINQNVNKIICTPHNDAFDFNREKVINNFKKLRVAKMSELSLYLGCEIACSKENINIIIGKIKRKIYPTINNTNYVLIEFSRNITFSDINYIVLKLIANDYIPIIAHTERYNNLNEEYYRLVDLQDMGCKMQINAYSLENERNEYIKDFARLIVKSRFASYIGSDAHRSNHRPPLYKDGIEYLKKNTTPVYFKKIIYSNAITDFNL